jgi:hypothetical protein
MQVDRRVVVWPQQVLPHDPGLVLKIPHVTGVAPQPGHALIDASARRCLDENAHKEDERRSACPVADCIRRRITQIAGQGRPELRLNDPSRSQQRGDGRTDPRVAIDGMEERSEKPAYRGWLIVNL